MKKEILTEEEDLRDKLKVALKALNSVKRWLLLNNKIKDDGFWSKRFVKANNTVIEAINIIKDKSKPN